MTYDAAELQDMRDRRDFLSANDVLALIDALEPFVEIGAAFMGVTDGYINVGTRNQLPLKAFVEARAALEMSGGVL